MSRGQFLVGELDVAVRQGITLQDNSFPVHVLTMINALLSSAPDRLARITLRAELGVLIPLMPFTIHSLPCMLCSPFFREQNLATSLAG